jgi:hypothetical protein
VEAVALREVIRQCNGVDDLVKRRARADDRHRAVERTAPDWAIELIVACLVSNLETVNDTPTS